MVAKLPIPFQEPPWLNGQPSPYYSESHRRLQRECRKFIDENLNKYALQWETEETVPPHVWTQFAKHNFLLGALPAPLPVSWLKRVGIETMPGDVKVDHWDALHSMIYTDEVRGQFLLLPRARY